MKAQIIQIGNSKGIRIPRPLLEQCQLEDEVELEAQPSGQFVDGDFVRTVIDDGSVAVTAYAVAVLMSVNQAAEQTDGVTLTGPGVSEIVPFNSVTVISGNSFALYEATTVFNYQPGSAYSLGVSTSIGTASGSAAAPGGITDTANGLQTSWTNPGNQDKVIVDEQPGGILTYQATPDALAPQSIPVTAYAAPATYTLSTYCVNQVLGMTGAAAGSGLEGMDILVTYYDFATTPTPTSTPTGTATHTFSPTISATPTVSFTPSKTPTITLTPTVTSTDTPCMNASLTPCTNTPTITPTNSLSAYASIGGTGAAFGVADGIRYNAGNLGSWTAMTGTCRNGQPRG